MDEKIQVFERKRFFSTIRIFNLKDPENNRQ